MKRFVFLVLAFAIASCGSSIEIKPDRGAGGRQETTSASSVSSSSSSSGQGEGGSTGNGLSCDPCMDRDGSRIVRHTTTQTSTDGLHHSQSNGIFYDTLFETDCTATRAEDLTLRCLPFSNASVGVFSSNADCSGPVVTAYVPPCDPNPPKFVLRTPSTGTCAMPFGSAVHNVGSEYVGPLYTMQNGVCIPATPAPGYSYFHLGNKIDATGFVEMIVTNTP